MAYQSGGKTKIPLLPTADYMAFQAEFFFWMLFQPLFCLKSAGNWVYFVTAQQGEM